jgi:exonuclease SbcD
MKILHTADWHLGKKLYHAERLPEQEAFLEELLAICDAQEIDCILVAGDLFDVGNPSNESVEIFYRYLKRLSKDGQRPIVVISGNHDSADRISAPNPLAQECGILLFGNPNETIPQFETEAGLKVSQSAPGFVEIQHSSWAFPLRIIATPFVNEVRLKRKLGADVVTGLQDYLTNHWEDLASQYFDSKGCNMVMSHLFVSKRGETPPEEPDGEKPVHLGTASIVYSDLFPACDYVALGHLHRSQEVRGGKAPVHYSGSPIAFSFSEAHHEKVVHVLECSPRLEKVEKVPIQAGRSLARKTCTTVKEAMEWLAENKECFTELTMETKEYLSGEEITELRGASKYLLNIVPKPILDQEEGDMEWDIGMDFMTLFGQYFKHKEGQEPGEDILEMLQEIKQL